MPTTRYGVRVGLNPQTRYTVLTSAAPILSHQKRYGVQVDNRVVLVKRYSFTTRAYSLRYAREESEARAKRKEREFPASLFMPTDSNIQQREFESEIERISGALNQHPEKDSFLHYSEYAQSNQLHIGHQTATYAYTRSHTDVMHTDEQMQADRSTRILLTSETLPERLESHQEELVSWDDLQRGNAVFNESDAFLETDAAALRTNDMKNATWTMDEPAIRPVQMHLTEINVLENGKYDRPLTYAHLLELDGAEIPFIKTYEHVIYSGSRIHKQLDVEQLSREKVDRLSLSDAILDGIDRVYGNGNLSNAVYDQFDLYKRSGRTYTGLDTHLKTTNPLVMTEDAIEQKPDLAVFEQVPALTELLQHDHAHADQRETDGVVSTPDHADRFIRTIPAMEQFPQHVFNNGQIVPAIVDASKTSDIVPSLRVMTQVETSPAIKGAANVRPSILSEWDVMHREGRHYLAYASELEQTLDNTVVQEGKLLPLESVEHSAEYRKEAALHLLERTSGNRTAVSTEIDAWERSTRRTEDALPVEEMRLHQVQGKEHDFDALLETMIMADKDGRLVEEARIEAAGRVRLEHGVDLTNSFRGALIGNIELITQDQLEHGVSTDFVKEAAFDEKEHGIRTTFIKDGMFDDTERVHRFLRTLPGQMLTQEAGENQRTEEIAHLSDMEQVVHAIEPLLAQESSVSKAYTVDSWIETALIDSEQANVAGTLSEASMTHYEAVERLTDTETAEWYVSEGAERTRTELAILNESDAAEKVAVYASDMVNSVSVKWNPTPGEAWINETVTAWNQAQQIGLPIVELVLEGATVQNEEYEADVAPFDGALGAAKDVDEQRIDATVRKQPERFVHLTFQDAGETDFRNTDVELTASAATQRTSGIRSATLSDQEPGTRADIVSDAIQDNQDAFYRQNEQRAYVEAFEKGLRFNERVAHEVDTFASAERMTIELAEQSDQLDQAARLSENDAIHFLMHTVERLSENDTILSGITEQAERMDQVMAALETIDSGERMDENLASLEPIEFGERIAVNDTFMTLFDASERRYLEETLLEDWYQVQRVTKPARLDEGVTAERIAVNYAERAEHLRGTRTLKFGVLVDAETAEHVAIESAELEHSEGSQLIIKKKKKIWLIPAHGNHWNNWSVWKKTR